MPNLHLIKFNFVGFSYDGSSTSKVQKLNAELILPKIKGKKMKKKMIGI